MSSQPLIKVVLADDHEIYRDGLKLLLTKSEGVEVAGEAGDGAQLVALIAQAQPDVVLTDIAMPVMDGISAAKQISSRYPGIGIIALSMYNEDNYIIDMLEAGAIGYLLKNAGKKEIGEAIRSAYYGKPYFCASTSARLAKLIAGSRYNPFTKKPAVMFTEREREVIALICGEKTNKEIGDLLFMSSRTAEGYRQRIQEKIGVRGTVGIVLYAVRHNLC